MKQHFYTLLAFACFLSCNSKINDQNQLLTDQIPTNTPIPFKSELIPSDQLIHKGTLNPNLTEYYFTLSDKNFNQFDVYWIRQSDGKWTEPSPAFFNSNYSEHGMSFSPDGNSIYFSSTRPVEIDGIADTWHIWKSEKVDRKWGEATFVDIPNLRNKLVSHPTASNEGTLYFHSSNLDYSEMDLYQSQFNDGKYEPAELVAINVVSSMGKCTPHIAADESYLLFAGIGNELDLYVSFNEGENKWTHGKKLNDHINHMGQGNPYVTPDHNFLFFTTGNPTGKDWQVKWVNVAELLIQK